MTYRSSRRPARVVAALAGVVALLATSCTGTPDRKPDETPTPGPKPRPGVIAAAGDIACGANHKNYNSGAGTSDGCQQRATADLVAKIRPEAVLALGDTQYQRAMLENYHKVYDPTWGRFKDITHPVPGNHEYKSQNAKGYFRYFGESAGDPDKGYYSFDMGDWHLVALNTECDEVDGCDRGSPQERWLRSDLAAHPNKCVLAFMHSPRFSSGGHGGSKKYDAFWEAFSDAGVELVLSGHDHHYERFAPLDADGQVDQRRGVRQFVVGTGGASHRKPGKREPGSEVANGTTSGVLELELLPGHYQWRFVPVPGGDSQFTDSGSAGCH